MTPHTTRLMPPASFRLRTRLAHVRCGFCGCRENPDEMGRIIQIPHHKRAICELCIDEADVMADCARLARAMPKATPKLRPGQPARRRPPQVVRLRQ